jgi:hypothetical protein
MRRLSLILVILLFASHASGQANPWSKYIPQNQSKPILKACLLVSEALIKSGLRKTRPMLYLPNFALKIHSSF